jgi:hypothetical protein
MILSLLSRFRRKPLTPESARDMIAADFGRAVKEGLCGFCIAVISRPGSTDAQASLATKGDITAGLSQVLQMLLSSPELKDSATMAIITALQASGGARVVQMAPIMGCDDPDCPVCRMGREMEGGDKQNTTRH